MKPYPSSLSRWMRSDWARLALFAALIFIARSSLANHYYVPSGSMQPVLQAGDRVVVDMTAYGIDLPFSHYDLIRRGYPRRGDIVVFNSPTDGTRLIKRVVAVAGDVVEVHAGHLILNGMPTGLPGEAVEQLGEHTIALDLSRGGGPDLAPWKVPAGRVLVMGDARGNSFDGRMFGPVEVNRIFGRAMYRFYRSGKGFEWFSL